MKPRYLLTATEHQRPSHDLMLTSEPASSFATGLELVLARDSGEDEAMWEMSGAEPVVMRFLDIVERLKEQITAQGDAPRDDVNSVSGSDGAVQQIRICPLPGFRFVPGQDQCCSPTRQQRP